MDDEEEDMFGPVSQHWGVSPCVAMVKPEDRAAAAAAAASQQAAAAGLQSPVVVSNATALAASQTHHHHHHHHHHNNNSISVNSALPCSRSQQQQFHILLRGNAGLCSHFPAHFEPMEDRGGERQVEEEEAEEEEGGGEEEEEDHRMVERPVEERAGMSVEAQIGRKLREIGDQFHQDHVELLLRHHQRVHLPMWMRLPMALFGFLFPRQPIAVPRLRDEQR